MSMRSMFAVAASVGIACGSVATAGNIVVNGGFEDPIVANPSGWDVYSAIPGWTLDVPDVDPPLGIEVWRGVNGWLPAEGSQNVELDADTIPPTNSNGSIAIYQDLTTVAGQTYEVTFAFSPRPGTGLADNVLEFTWDGVLVDTLTADGSSLSQTDWTYYSYEFVASGGVTRLMFANGGENNSLGTLLDAVCVRAVPEPSTFVLGALGLAGVVVLRRRRRLA